MTKFVLASASVARLKLLRMVGIEPIVSHSNFDESSVNLTHIPDLVNTLAFKKAEIVANVFPSSLVLGCDSVLEVEGEIYGKPDNPKVAITRWQQMRGKVGKLYTGHALINTDTQEKVIQCGITEVFFAYLNDSEIEFYVATGEPLKCAGNFALEGKGGLFVEKIVGCHSNVIGLSLPLLRVMLADLHYQITDFW
ncbi:MAG: septum formation inhibitor Maf [Cyanobacteria bacterium]|nr:septum formation inhibitor Maf [Cyanobacteria bacterium CG_2015-16_32_12]NCO79189.1 septum formation inhibitor Maf [Cyanobacteria bacterium CG_2015-22_32_23]NCQ04931.1 septum formation inhibitor Maf [Cyanobacteria bacterium CG_2015-09_32_10]NCQ41268.1 septum formation inhibitor Maf [Cyanobacteria bacterium CG_2015-04_32_10]NCS84092.1 septum formation inhibitor Maf [Cyanobacteria bacterium CG_2015-02_32_10]